MLQRDVVRLGLAAVPFLLAAACGGRVVVDLSGAGGSSSASVAASSVGTGGAASCQDLRSLCASYCQSFVALGCTQKAPHCLDDCLGSLFLGSPAACRSAIVAAVSCTIAKGPSDCLTNFSAACSAEEAALSSCWDLTGPCNGFHCGACGCGVTGCTPVFSTACQVGMGGIECQCLRDGQVLGTCTEASACGEHFPGCCAGVFFPPCGV